MSRPMLSEVREMKLPLNLKMKEVVGKSVWRNYTLKNQ
jgi:hypothetical protein